MSPKRKFVIRPPYLAIILLELSFAILWIYGPYARRPVPRELTVVLAILSLIMLWRRYVFTEEGIKSYILGIRVRNVPWSKVRRLILLDDQTSRKVKDHSHYLVVEKQNCEPPFPDEGNAWKLSTFFLLHPAFGFKISINKLKWSKEIEGVEQFHKIDEYYVWVRGDDLD